MWSAVPDVEDLSSGSGSDEGKSPKSEDSTTGDRPPSSLPATSNAVFDTVTAPPRGVSEQHWQTFCKLKRRREDSLQSQSKNRPKKPRKKCRTDVSSSEATLPSSSSAIQKDDKSGLNAGNGLASEPNPDTESPEPLKRSLPTEEQQKHWDTLKKNLNVNEHIYQGIDHGQYNTNKSGLEKKLDQAVDEGDFEQAEELSNQLATRDLACRIARSASARDYLEWKEAEETRKKAKRRKRKLNWGFEAKERWQMKGNM